MIFWQYKIKQHHKYYSDFNVLFIQSLRFGNSLSLDSFYGPSFSCDLQQKVDKFKLCSELKTVHQIFVIY